MIIITGLMIVIIITVVLIVINYKCTESSAILVFATQFSQNISCVPDDEKAFMVHRVEKRLLHLWTILTCPLKKNMALSHQ